MNKNDKQKVLQVGSLVKVRLREYVLQGTVVEMDDENVIVDIPTYYRKGFITKRYSKDEVKLVTHECPKRAGE